MTPRYPGAVLVQAVCHYQYPSISGIISEIMTQQCSCRLRIIPFLSLSLDISYLAAHEWLCQDWIVTVSCIARIFIHVEWRYDTHKELNRQFQFKSTQEV